MKKRCLLGLLGACMVFMLTGCETLGALGTKEPTIEGEWEATWDLTDLMLESMGEEMADYADCFEDIKIEVTFEFSEDEVEIVIDEDSVKDMAENIESSCIKMFDALMEDMAAEAQMSVDDIFALLGTTREAYLETFLGEVDFDSLVSEITEELETEAEYKYDEDDENVILVTYDDGEEEEWEIELEEDELTIVIELEEMEIEFECERK